MKKNMMLLVGLMISSLVFAQKGERNPYETAERQSEHLKTKLNLNEAQYTSIKKINESYAEKFDQLRITANDQEKRAAFKTLHHQRINEINKQLTPEQQEKWSDIRQERKKKGKKSKEEKAQKKEEKKEELRALLSLTPEQETSMENARADFKAEMRKLKDNESLTKEQKKQQMQGLKGKHKETIKGILTPEQYEKWKAYKEQKKKEKGGKEDDED